MVSQRQVLQLSLGLYARCKSWLCWSYDFQRFRNSQNQTILYGGASRTSHWGDLQCTPYPLSSFSWLFAWPQKEPTDAWVARKSFIFPTRKITLTKFTSFFIKINIPSPIKSQFSGVHQIAIFRYHPVQASFVATIITSVPLLWTSSFLCTYVMLILNNRCLQNPC